MGLFSKNELIIMVSILGVMLLIIVILTVLDLIDERRSKKNKVKEEKEVIVKNEEVTKKVLEVEEIEVLDFDEPIIEMKEELENNVVLENNSEEPVINELEEVTFVDVLEEVKEEYKDSNIIEITNEKERAKEELERLEIELQKDEEFSNTITNFELEQEENAIISYDELVKISDKLYDQNEVVQYDDGDEPITIDEVIKRFASSEMTFENTANLDKLNKEIDNKEQSLIKAYDNE